MYRKSVRQNDNSYQESFNNNIGDLVKKFNEELQIPEDQIHFLLESVSYDLDDFIKIQHDILHNPQDNDFTKSFIIWTKDEDDILSNITNTQLPEFMMLKKIKGQQRMIKRAQYKQFNNILNLLEFQQ